MMDGHQVEQLRSQLRQQSRLVESLSMTEQDLQMELNTVKQRLTVMNKELLDKEAEVCHSHLTREVLNYRNSILDNWGTVCVCLRLLNLKFTSLNFDFHQSLISCFYSLLDCMSAAP